MRIKTISILSFLLLISNIFAQDYQQIEQDCPFYYDTLLQKKVYERVELYPRFESGDLPQFTLLVNSELHLGEENYKKVVEESIICSYVTVCFVVNEQGTLENIHLYAERNQRST